MNQVAAVNRELKARGVADIKLRAGRGYYYFDGPAISWPSSSVYTYRADDLSVAEWLQEFDQLRAAAVRAGRAVMTERFHIRHRLRRGDRTGASARTLCGGPLTAYDATIPGARQIVRTGWCSPHRARCEACFRQLLDRDFAAARRVED